MNDGTNQIEAREFSVRTPGVIEHIGVRPRDWNDIKEAVGHCQKPNSWLGNCAWTMLGGALGGGFGLIALTTGEQVTATVWALMVGATVVTTALAGITFVLDFQLGKGVADSVQKLREKMDSIVDESDRKDAI